MNERRRFLIAVAALTLLRAAAAAMLPLSADEAYYWLWSRHLAAGYFDHPPAIAYIIRVGTILFGDTAFGVRFGALVLSALSSVLVWRAGALLTRDERIAARACLYFNLTLMISVETLAATPDAPAVAAAAAMLYALAALIESGQGAWWLGVGAAAGLGLLSKYTALFLGAGIAVWLVLAAEGRRWLMTAWPWAGAALAVLLFAPNLFWNADHRWMTFAFQFGRIGGGHLTLRFLIEFLGVQLVLASPFLFVLAALGLAFRERARDDATFLLAALAFPSALYFLIHSLHDRIQGNWPSFLYPVLAIGAALAFVQTDWTGWRKPVWRVARSAATPLAAIMLVAVYAQAFFSVVPFGRSDPLARLLAVGIDDVADNIDAARKRVGAAAIVTTDYESTAWYAFYLRKRPPLIQTTDSFRYPDAPVPDAALLSKPLIYVAEKKLDRHDELRRDFADVDAVATFDRKRRGVAIAHYTIYRLSHWRGARIGRML